MPPVSKGDRNDVDQPTASNATKTQINRMVQLSKDLLVFLKKARTIKIICRPIQLHPSKLANQRLSQYHGENSNPHRAKTDLNMPTTGNSFPQLPLVKTEILNSELESY